MLGYSRWQLIGATDKVLVRSGLHPEIVALMLQAMVEAHGARAIFQRSGEFPNGTDTEYPVALAATDFYKNGPSLMQRHVPLWLSVHVQRALAVLVTAIAIGYPLFRLMPVATLGSTVGACSIGCPTQGLGSFVRH